MARNQMIAHELNPLKGWPSPYAVDKVLEVNVGDGSGVTITAANAALYFVAGKVATQAENGKLVLGVTALDDDVCPMPIFVFPNAKDFDVIGDEGNMVGMNTAGVNFAYTGGGTSPFTQRPLVVGLVACGAYELETTEWVAADSSDLTPGRLLTGVEYDDTNATTLDASGRLGVATVETDAVICGVVSDGLITSEFVTAPTSAAQRLRFWPVFLPVWHRA